MQVKNRVRKLMQNSKEHSKRIGQRGVLRTVLTGIPTKALNKLSTRRGPLSLGSSFYGADGLRQFSLRRSSTIPGCAAQRRAPLPIRRVSVESRSHSCATEPVVLPSQVYRRSLIRDSRLGTATSIAQVSEFDNRSEVKSPGEEKGPTVKFSSRLDGLSVDEDTQSPQEIQGNKDIVGDTRQSKASVVVDYDSVAPSEEEVSPTTDHEVCCSFRRSPYHLRDVVYAEEALLGRTVSPNHHFGTLRSRRSAWLPRCIARLTWSCVSVTSPPFNDPAKEARFHKLLLAEDVRMSVAGVGITCFWVIATVVLGNVFPTQPHPTLTLLVGFAVVIAMCLTAAIPSMIVTSQPGVIGRLRVYAFALTALVILLTVYLVFIAVRQTQAEVLITYEGSYDLPLPLKCEELNLYIGILQLSSIIIPFPVPVQLVLQLMLEIYSVVMFNGGQVRCAPELESTFPGSLFSTLETPVIAQREMQRIAQSLRASGFNNTQPFLLEASHTRGALFDVCTSFIGVMAIILSFRNDRIRRHQFQLMTKSMEAQKEANQLLENLFPSEIANSLKNGNSIQPRLHKQVREAGAQCVFLMLSCVP